jgi:hypothetical protein
MALLVAPVLKPTPPSEAAKALFAMIVVYW